MRILFITATRIGDAVLSSGVLGRLIERHPGARITVACGPAAAPLFAAVPGLERVIVLAKRRRGLHWIGLWRQVVGTFWDLVVDLRHSATSYVVATRKRLVYRASKKPVHRVVQLGALLGEYPPPSPRLWTHPADDARAAALIPGQGPVLALGPTANWGGKQWPAERFAALAERLTAPEGILPGAQVAVFGAGNERDAARPVLALPGVLDLVGRLDLPTTSACLRRCVLYIGNDSGLMHMAAAAGVPTLGLFGPSRDEHYHPWSERAHWVRTPESYDEIVSAPGYSTASQVTRMGSLTVDAVEVAAMELWRQRRG